MRRPVSVPLGLRLAVAGGRDGATRITVMTAGVAIGVALLLLALTALPALRGRGGAPRVRDEHVRRRRSRPGREEPRGCPAALRELDQGLRLALLFVLVVAACSLTVAAIAGVTERRRPFALLRASGVRVAELRRTVLLETAVPLAATLLAGTVIGLAVGAAITTAGGQHWRPPGSDFLTSLALELLIAVAVTALPLPLINRLTRHEAVRFD